MEMSITCLSIYSHPLACLFLFVSPYAVKVSWLNLGVKLVSSLTTVLHAPFALDVQYFWSGIQIVVNLKWLFSFLLHVSSCFLLVFMTDPLPSLLTVHLLSETLQCVTATATGIQYQQSWLCILWVTWICLTCNSEPGEFLELGCLKKCHKIGTIIFPRAANLTSCF